MASVCLYLLYIDEKVLRFPFSSKMEGGFKEDPK